MDENRAALSYDFEGIAKILPYSQIKKIGEGTFGDVYYIRLKTGEEYALKVVLESNSYINREIEILKKVKHENIVHMKKYFYGKESNNGIYLNILMDYLGSDLYAIIKQKYFFSREQMIGYSLQIMSGVDYLHKKRIAHRDIKPSNILIDISKSLLKICDLGSAKEIKKGENNTIYICSRHYRAPEVHLQQEYGLSMDIWSVGCVLAEMIMHRTLYKAESKEKMVKIIEEKDEHLMEYLIEQSKRQDLADLIEIIIKMLKIDPNQRITASQAHKEISCLQK
ncbi:hypothetical protein NEFER03_2180 [Nematocida sp. LUAm3]|nr:hypothetical protein NEFER03_2180 [Nematocida sp. LUAm3]KAI5176288.1 hypothetical protein NEFER02_2080 [Nematocida sp. LUAm2]KAI5179240.1 hypothetical protein NEFER01_2094 [Nematocida sp. LUAm1]